MTKSNFIYFTVLVLLGLCAPASCFDVAKVLDSLKEGLLIPFAVMFPSKKIVGPNEGLQIIGAGFPRTGTMSTDAALRELGHRVYRLDEILRTPTHKERWLQAAKDWKERDDLTEVKKLVEEIEEMGYTATLDFPMCFFAPAFAEIRPEAKAILTMRDTPEKWVASFLSIIKTMAFTSCRPWKWLMRGFDLKQNLQTYFVVFGGDDMKFPVGTYPENFARPLPWYEYVHTLAMETPEWEKKWIDFYHKLNAESQEAIPSENLIVFNVKEGWPPLVPFLGLDPALADKPFPNVNDRQSVALASFVGASISVTFPLMILLVLYGAYKAVNMVLGLVQEKKSKVKSV